MGLANEVIEVCESLDEQRVDTDILADRKVRNKHEVLVLAIKDGAKSPKRQTAMLKALIAFVEQINK